MKISVIGAGAWGTALAIAAEHAGNKVTLWGRNAGTAPKISTARLTGMI